MSKLDNPAGHSEDHPVASNSLGLQALPDEVLRRVIRFAGATVLICALLIGGADYLLIRAGAPPLIGKAITGTSFLLGVVAIGINMVARAEQKRRHPQEVDDGAGGSETTSD